MQLQKNDKVHICVAAHDEWQQKQMRIGRWQRYCAVDEQLGLPGCQTLELLLKHAHTSTSCVPQRQHQTPHLVGLGPIVSNAHTLCSVLVTCV
jgi:hypothetical protein